MTRIKESKDYDYIFKVVLIGDTNVGKSCLLTRFADDQFSDSYFTTIGVDFTMIVNGKVAKVQVWDTAGQERYRAITKAYYRGAEAIIIVFSLDDEVSFRNIRQWMEDVVKYTGNDVLVAVAANKADLDERKVNEKDINELKQTQKVCVYEMSAKTGKGVEEAFEKVVEELIRRKRNEQGNDARRGERELLIGGGGDSKYNNVNRACCW